MSSVDTIAAISTAQGRGGVGVIRVSGNKVRQISEGILGYLLHARYATFTRFRDGNGDTLDQGIALFFPAPHSFTGEDILELQGHGGFAVLQMVLQRCLELGARLAEPGEFTRRAFLNNKLDLAQAESVADLIDANSKEAARSALRSLSGVFSSTVHAIVDDLIHLRMLVEAMLDFPEEDLDFVDISKRDRQLSEISRNLDTVFEQAKQGALLRNGANVVIIGQPNVGKSSLMNKLSGEDVALVSNIPGTTRDVIRQEIHISGVSLHIMDTAGVRRSDDVVENMGIEKTRQTVNKADLILLIVDASVGLSDQDKNILSELPREIPFLQVFNKSDLIPYVETETIDKSKLFVSAKTEMGLDKLRGRILDLIGWRDQEGGTFMARERHLQALLKAKTHLYQARATLNNVEFFAEELRLAQLSLNQITGEFTPDDLLGEIFSKFCIGK